MFDFSQHLNLPLIFGFIISFAIFMYVLLDGFDLGIGILFPFAPSDKCRDRMINSIAPFWDGNETWLVLGGGGLFAAFPLAYSILLPAFYFPIIVMLLGLILRGVAFEFRYKAEVHRRALWDYGFHIGSLTATFCQGAILGAFIEGIKVHGRHFSGGPLDWLTNYSIMTGLALIAGYSLIGATWLVMKTEDITQAWARKIALYVSGFVVFFLFLVTIIVPLNYQHIGAFWFSKPNFYYLLALPTITVVGFLVLWRDCRNQDHESRPFFTTIIIFLSAYTGLALSLYPWIVPFHFTLTEAASSGPALSLMLIGIVPLLPLILAYTGYCYYLFRGKSSNEQKY